MPPGTGTAGSGRPACLITGASTGIGAALAREYAAAGWAVGLVARRLPLLEELADSIRAAGGIAACAAADVTDPASIRHAVAAIEAQLGPCALVIANAGGNPGELRTFGDGAGVLANMRLNFDGVVHTVAAALPGLRACRGAPGAASGIAPAVAPVVAIVSSAAAFRGMAGDGGYAVSKRAASALGEMLRVELAGEGIAVCVIQPGFVQTPLTDKNHFPMPFMLSAPDAARRIRRAIGRRARVYTFPWPMWLATLIGAALPGWAWDPVARRLFVAARDGKGKDGGAQG